MATSIQVILSADVPHLGHMGDVVTVRKGYARNYLLPRGMAVVATPRNTKHLQHEKRVIEKKVERNTTEAKDVAERLKTVSITVAKKVAEEDKLYGSVTARDIQAALEADEIKVEHRQIQLKEPIKHLGVFNVPVALARDVEAEVKVWVVEEEEEE